MMHASFFTVHQSVLQCINYELHTPTGMSAYIIHLTVHKYYYELKSAYIIHYTMHKLWTEECIYNAFYSA